MPVVDFANSTLGYELYFEFNQTSHHETSQSVDIALLESGHPRVMVEAKRADKRIGAEQIAKYLVDGTRGIVSNGADWILCEGSQSKALSIHRDRVINDDALAEIVAFVRGASPSNSWSTEETYVDPSLEPEHLKKATRARRVSNPVELISNCETLRVAVAKLTTTTELEQLLLQQLANHLAAAGPWPPHIRCELRSSRISMFDVRVKNSNEQRVARIEFGKQHPDVLIRTLRVTPGLAQIAVAAPHDKGPHMRRYRLNGQDQVTRFSQQLASVLAY